MISAEFLKSLRIAVRRSMIITKQEDVTEAVLSELQRADDPRFREIMSSAIRHLHAFVRECRLSEVEFYEACDVLAKLGQLTTSSHNEVVLAAGVTGLSSLLCLLNNGNNGQTETSASLMGPFWRTNSPDTPNGNSIVRSPTPGIPVFVDGWIRDPKGNPIEGAKVEVWHTSSEGFYENEDPAQADMNLRGLLTSDAEGHIWFHSIKPASYPIPVTGPVGSFLRAQGRHNLRPAHIHFMIYKEGYKTQFSQVFSSDDPNLDSDVVFGVTRALIGDYILHQNEPDPLGHTGRWYSLEYKFTLEPGPSTKPRPPISSKSKGERPVWTVLERKP
jgi:hydroxyquinol 1,2-dioxygenase